MRSAFVTAALFASVLAAPLAQEDTSQVFSSTVLATMDPTIAAATEAYVDPIRTDTASSELAAPTGPSNATMTTSSSSASTYVEPTTTEPAVTGGVPVEPTDAAGADPEATHAWDKNSWKGWWGHRKGRRPQQSDGRLPTQYTTIDSDKSTLEIPAPTAVEATNAAISTAVEGAVPIDTAAEQPTRPTLTMTATTTMQSSSTAAVAESSSDVVPTATLSVTA